MVSRRSPSSFFALLGAKSMWSSVGIVIYSSHRSRPANRTVYFTGWSPFNVIPHYGHAHTRHTCSPCLRCIQTLCLREARQRRNLLWKWGNIMLITTSVNLFLYTGLDVNLWIHNGWPEYDPVLTFFFFSLPAFMNLYESARVDVNI